VQRSEIQAKVSEAYESGNLILSCAWCARLCLDGEWLHAPSGVLSTVNSHEVLSHGICPSCMENAGMSEAKDTDQLGAEEDLELEYDDAATVAGGRTAGGPLEVIPPPPPPVK
jgi:hypothetical protein